MHWVTRLSKTLSFRSFTFMSQLNCYITECVKLMRISHYISHENLLCENSYFCLCIICRSVLSIVNFRIFTPMGLFPDTKIAGCACAGNAGNVFPAPPSKETASQRSRQPLTRGGGENVPNIPGACATHDLTYLARGPLGWISENWQCRIENITYT